ncbi:MAG TPA: thioesterase family protein [Micromonosporaceae bacterium]
MTDPAGVPDDAIAGVPSVYHARVRWSDPDVMGHVNHARYLSFFEDARMTLLATSPAGLAGGANDRGYIAARVAVDYLSPAEFRPGILLRVESVVCRIGTSSWTFDQRMFDGDRPIARCECVLVAYSYANGKPRPLDADEREFWARLLVTGDAPVAPADGPPAPRDGERAGGPGPA